MKTESENLKSATGFIFHVQENFRRNYILYSSFLIFWLFYFVTRLPYFLYNSGITFTNDYQSYYVIVDQISKGFFPTFTVRTPGYPLFLALIFLFFKTNMAVVVAQNLLSLVAPMFFIFTINRIFKNKFKLLPVLASLGMGIFVSLPIHLHLDSTLLTESLYINTIILSFSFLFLCIYLNKKTYWILCGLSMAVVILIRPVGLFLIVIFFILLIFLILNSAKKKIIFLFSLSFIGPLFFMCLYNYFTIGSFSVSTFSEHAMISFTSSILEENPAYKPQLNRAIKRIHNRLRRFEQKTKKISTNTRKKGFNLYRGYNRNRIIIFRSLLSAEDDKADNLYLKWRPMLRKASFDAIRKHPMTYLKYFYVNLINYFFQRKTYDFFKWMRIQNQNIKTEKSKKIRRKYADFSKASAKDRLRLYYKNEYIKTRDQQFLKDLLKEYWNPQGQTKEPNDKKENKTIQLHFLQKVHKVFFRIHQTIFLNHFWILFFFFTFVFAFFRTLFTRFRHRGSLIMFIMTFSALLHGVVISMSSIPDARLSYPMNFIYYLSFFFFPVLFLQDSNFRRNSPPSSK